MPPKRRIHVAFEGDENSQGDMKRQRKFIVSIDADATIEQLATQISTCVDQAEDTLKPQLAGFELLRKDSIDIIRDGELVVATSKDTTVPLSVTKPRTTFDKSHIAHPDEPSRMQVRIVTADLARIFAKENPKQQIEPTNRILTFDGELISGNVTFGVLQNEVARVPIRRRPRFDILEDNGSFSYGGWSPAICVSSLVLARHKSARLVVKD